MNKWIVITLSSFLLSGCISLQGNYQKNRTGYAIKEDWIVTYRTNSLGQIDSFILDQFWSLEEALSLFPQVTASLDEFSSLNVLTQNEITSCNGIINQSYPRFLSIEQETYMFYQTPGYECGYYGFMMPTSDWGSLKVNLTEYLGPLNFSINPFTDIIGINYVTPLNNTYQLHVLSPLPMSLRQSGNTLEESYDQITQLDILQRYILENQSINLLILRDEISEELPQVWSDATVEALGRNHEIIRAVDLPMIANVLKVIDLALERLGMFR